MKKNFVMRTLVLTACIAFSASSYGQQWVDMMVEPNANFFEIQKEFNKEWEGKSYERGKGWKQFKRWEYFWEMRINQDGTFPKYAEMWQSFQDFGRDANGDRTGGGPTSAGNWSPMGPFGWQNTDSWSPGQGRVNCVVEDPNNSQIIYVGTPAGGIWKSIDAGANWLPIGDTLPSIGVSMIVVDPTNSDIIYMATGDAEGGDTYSIGIYKSTDGGTSWGPTASIAGATNDLVMHPTDPTILITATTGGVFKTTDSGGSWTLLMTGNYDDIEFKPNDGSVVYMTTTDYFYRSTDGGNNWTQTTAGLPTSGARMRIAVTPADDSYVYLVAANDDNTYNGVYRSTDEGASFTSRNTTTDIFDGSAQAWYDLDIGVSETDPETLLCGNLNVWRSTNGGTSWSSMNSWSNPSGQGYTHADIHFVRYYGGNLYVGSDGGIYLSIDNGTTFTDLTEGLQIGQFYTIAGTEQDPDLITGGLQDNGGYALVNGTWRVWYGADGMESAINPNNSSRILGMIQNGSLYRSSNQGASNQGSGSPGNGAWVTPMTWDPNATRILAGYDDVWEHNTTQGQGGWNQVSSHNFPGTLRVIEIFSGNSDIFYAATVGNLYRTADGGGSFTDVTNFNAGAGITGVETHPTDPDIIYTSSGGTSATTGKVHVTYDGGATWTNITGNLPNINVNIIKHETGSDEGLYIGTDIGVYYRDTLVGAWVPFNLNLPNVIVNDLEIHHGTGMIRAGTYGRGVWESGTYSPPSVADDAGIQSVLEPEEVNCGVQFDAVVRIRNYGTNTLTSATIHYDLDGGASSSFAWTGNIAPGMATNVTLPTVIVLSGNHTFNAWTSDPNGNIDAYCLNDPSFTNFSVYSVGNPVTVTLSTDCFGSQTTWTLLDDQGATVDAQGPYQDLVGGETIAYEYCLDDGCYEVLVFDQNGDGLNGSTQGGCSTDGDLVITDRTGVTLATLGNPAFGASTSLNFCANNPLIGDFTTTKTLICAGSDITLIDQSSGSPSAWAWILPGGSPSTASSQNVSVNYSVVGTYDVALIVTNGTSTDTILMPNFLTVVSSPIVTVFSTPETCVGDCDGTLSASSTGGLAPFTFVWTGGIGHGESFTNVCGGNYNLVVTDDNGCTASGLTGIVEPGINTLASFVPDSNPVLLSLGGTVQFTNGSIAGSGPATYAWDFGDSGSSTVENPSHTYTAVGTYTVSLSVTDSSGQCDNTYTLDQVVLLDDVGTEEFDPSSNLSIYPNPGNDAINLALENPEKSNVQINVYNQLGDLVASETLISGSVNAQLNMQVQASGLYHVHLVGADWQWSQVWALVR